MMNLTEAQQWVQIPNIHKTRAIRPSAMANDIDTAFNCVAHDKLIDILQHYKFPHHWTGIITNFNSNRKIFLAFDGNEEEPVPFLSGLPQGSPLSPILFVRYAAALNGPGQQPRLRQTTSYMDNEVITQGANTQKAATKALQARLYDRIDRARFLNIRFAPKRSELMRLIAHKSIPPKNADPEGITIKTLGVWIAHRLGFKRHSWLPQGAPKGPALD